MFIAFEGPPRIVRLFGTGLSNLAKSHRSARLLLISTSIR